ncbi:Os08g0356366, partial [Oryza sativa Japonica Group]
ALSCCLIPQGWLPGESLVLAPLSPDGRRRWFFHRFSSWRHRFGIP